MQERDVIPAPAPAVLLDLREKLRRLERGRGAADDGAVPFGEPLIDDRLPWGGLCRGGLHEVVGEGGDDAACGFATALLARLGGHDRRRGQVLWSRSRRLDQETGRPYGPG